MKKGSILLILILILTLMGCTAIKRDQPDTTPGEVENPTENNTEKEEELLKIEDFYPLLSDTRYAYAGEGSEYASYEVTVDYSDDSIKRMQTRTNNGGTEVIEVLEIKDGTLSVIFSKGEAYYRDNYLKMDPQKNSEILLKEPLVKGTEWTLSYGSKRSITNTEVNIETPLGDYKTLEVTTEGKNSTVKDYYAPKVGLVKSIFNSEGSSVTSTLTEIEENTIFKKQVEFYYPGQDEKIHAKEKTILLRTNEITKIKLQEAMKEKPAEKDLLPLLSKNTKINTLYLGNDSIAYVDLSKEFIQEMNAGALYESLILQGVANTMGNYYGVEKVYLTVEGKPYESGHMAYKKGETIKVDMDNVVRE